MDSSITKVEGHRTNNLRTNIQTTEPYKVQEHSYIIVHKYYTNSIKNFTSLPFPSLLFETFHPSLQFPLLIQKKTFISSKPMCIGTMQTGLNNNTQAR
jgi:hypothetical protein